MLEALIIGFVLVFIIIPFVGLLFGMLMHGTKNYIKNFSLRAEWEAFKSVKWEL